MGERRQVLGREEKGGVPGSGSWLFLVVLFFSSLFFFSCLVLSTSRIGGFDDERYVLKEGLVVVGLVAVKGMQMDNVEWGMGNGNRNRKGTLIRSRWADGR